MRERISLITLITICLATGNAAADEAGIDFFEKKIRPVLHRECYRCHASDSKRVKGGLVLDSAVGWLRGGDSGPSIVPGKPDESLLIHALRYADDAELEMPPKGRLDAQTIADFETWVRLGAPAPESVQDSAALQIETIDLDAGREFWCFRPLANAAVPEVEAESWPLGDVDRFLLARLEASDISPVSETDAKTLLRRLTFVLTGLPPTPPQIDSFLAGIPDGQTLPTEEHLADCVDELLGSRHFAERFGRHWLDIARYADSTGGGRTRALVNAWRYRDWVIDSFDADKPFDLFVRQQLAGDLMPTENVEEARDALLGTAFLMLGPHNYENQDKDLLRMDVVDEQIDTTGRAFLAMTLGCARCHDHKFDPIPTRDYYALAGILRSTKSLLPGNVAGHIERPLPVSQEMEHDYTRIAELGKLEKAARGRVEKLQKKLESMADHATARRILVDDDEAQLVGDWKPSTSVVGYVGKRYLHDSAEKRGEKSATFTPSLPWPGRYEVRYAYTAGDNRSGKVPVTIHSADGDPRTVHVDQRKPPPIDGSQVRLGVFRQAPGHPLRIVVENRVDDGHVIVDGLVFLYLDELPPGTETSARARARSQQDALRAKHGKANEELARLTAERKSLADRLPPREMTLSVQEEKNIEDWHIHIRGEIRNLGPRVPRGFLAVTQRSDASGAESASTSPITDKSSGRLELADWIASAENPLTARVWVNRVWHHIFGAGLVRTVDNFGSMGEAPSHPELLDWLAARFIESGWSTQQLVRELVLSRTFRLSSEHADRDESAHGDSENRLLWRAHRRRLDAESLRDAMLLASGTLDDRAGGPSIQPVDGKVDKKIEYGYVYASKRRSVYVPVFRNALFEFFDVFDFPNPNLVGGRRVQSTRSTQALYLLNSPYVRAMAEAFAARLAREGQATKPEESIVRAYRLALGRPPTDAETRLALDYLRDGKDPDAFSGLAHALFACVDFRFLR